MLPQAKQFRLVPAVPKELRVGQIVVQHNIGPRQALLPAQREQPGITGPGADKINGSRC